MNAARPPLDPPRRPAPTLDLEDTIHPPAPRSGATSTTFDLAWSAVLAGALVAVGIELILGLFGLALAVSELAYGAAAWSASAAMIAMFAAGYAATRIAELSRRRDAMLHGGFAWVLATTIALVLGGLNPIAGAVLTSLHGEPWSAFASACLALFAALLGGFVAVRSDGYKRPGSSVIVEGVRRRRELDREAMRHHR
jgi:hypothetical protein